MLDYVLDIANNFRSVAWYIYAIGGYCNIGYSSYIRRSPQKWTLKRQFLPEVFCDATFKESLFFLLQSCFYNWSNNEIRTYLQQKGQDPRLSLLKSYMATATQRIYATKWDMRGFSEGNKSPFPNDVNRYKCSWGTSVIVLLSSRPGKYRSLLYFQTMFPVYRKYLSKPLMVHGQTLYSIISLSPYSDASITAIVTII